MGLIKGDTRSLDHSSYRTGLGGAGSLHPCRSSGKRSTSAPSAHQCLALIVQTAFQRFARSGLNRALRSVTLAQKLSLSQNGL